MQDQFNVLKREEERDMIPFCLDQGVGLTPYSPLAKGRATRPWGEQTARSATNIVATAFDRDVDKPVIEKIPSERSGNHVVERGSRAERRLGARPSRSLVVAGAVESWPAAAAVRDYRALFRPLPSLRRVVVVLRSRRGCKLIAMGDEDVADCSLLLRDGRTIAWTECGGADGVPLLRFPGVPGSRWVIRADRTPWRERSLRVITSERHSRLAVTLFARLRAAQSGRLSTDLRAGTDETERDYHAYLKSSTRTAAQMLGPSA